MRNPLLAAAAAFVVCAPAQANIAVMANISGTATGSVTDYTCDQSGCTISNVSNFVSPFTASINDDAPSFDFSFNVQGLEPITFDSAAPGAGIIASGDQLNKQFLTLHHGVAGVTHPSGGNLVTDEELDFTFNGMGFLQTVSGNVVSDFSVPFTSKHRITFDISNATVTGSISGTSIAGIPEPSTWAMMLIGFGGVSMALRQKRRVSGQRQTVLG